MSHPSHPNRLWHHPPEALGIEANAGVDLAAVGGGGAYLVTPRHPPEPSAYPQAHVDPFLLPPLPGWQLERMGRLLRAVWRRANARATWMLYLHLAERRWLPYLPPQWCDQEGSRANLSYPKVTVPGHELRLAGTFTCSPDEDARLLEPHLPPRDGLHLVLHPDRGDGRDWLRATAFLTAAGAVAVARLDEVVADGPGPGEAAAGEAELLQRLWIATPS